MNNKSLFAVVMILLFGVFAIAGINASHDTISLVPGLDSSIDVGQVQVNTPVNYTE